MNKAEMKTLVDRFLTWPVPADAHPDGEPGKPGRTGTNLLSAAQAEQMLRYVLASYTPEAAADARKPYSIDADPDGIRALVCDAVTGALTLGVQNSSPPPMGHWLAPFWQFGKNASTGAAADAPAAPERFAEGQGEPDGYESTTAVYIRYVSPERFRKFSPAVQKWYRPYWIRRELKPVDVNWLASVIRTVDGDNTMGAGALAEAIVEAMGRTKEGT
jgi:hypothetical protein